MHALRSSAVSGLKSLNAIKAQPHLGPDHPSYPADAGCSSEFRDRCTTSATSPYAYWHMPLIYLTALLRSETQ